MIGNPGNVTIILLVAFVYLIPPRGSWLALALVVSENSLFSPPQIWTSLQRNQSPELNDRGTHAGSSTKEAEEVGQEENI